jgi:hypothetical protein
VVKNIYYPYQEPIARRESTNGQNTLRGVVKKCDVMLMENVIMNKKKHEKLFPSQLSDVSYIKFYI